MIEKSWISLFLTKMLPAVQDVHVAPQRLVHRRQRARLLAARRPPARREPLVLVARPAAGPDLAPPPAVAVPPAGSRRLPALLPACAARSGGTGHRRPCPERRRAARATASRSGWRESHRPDALRGAALAGADTHSAPGTGAGVGSQRPAPDAGGGATTLRLISLHSPLRTEAWRTWPPGLTVRRRANGAPRRTGP